MYDQVVLAGPGRVPILTRVGGERGGRGAQFTGWLGVLVPGRHGPIFLSSVVPAQRDWSYSSLTPFEQLQVPEV